MGRSPCCDKVGLKKGPWTPEEDQKLLAYIEEHGHGSWRALPSKAGLQRCGKSCRLRWTNYLRPDIKRGKFSLQEEQTIIQLHALLGNRWSAIATHLPKRTDNEIKNYWNTHLKKRLTKMGIDPVTHKPKNDTLASSSIDGGSGSGSNSNNKNSANLSHMAQWESARLEAEARLVRESRIRSNPFQGFPPTSLAPPASAPVSVSVSVSALTSVSSELFNKKATITPEAPPPCRSLDVLNAWHGMWSKSTVIEVLGDGGGGSGIQVAGGLGSDLESPTSTLSFSENNGVPLIRSTGIGGESNSNSMAVIDFVGNSNTTTCDDHHGGGGMIKEEGGGEDQEEWKGFNSSSRMAMENSISFTIHDHHQMAAISSSSSMMEVCDGAWNTSTTNADDFNSLRNGGNGNASNNGEFMMEGFTDLLLNNYSNDHHHHQRSSSDGGGDGGSGGSDESGSDDCDQENRDYWNTILDLVNSSPPDSPMF